MTNRIPAGNPLDLLGVRWTPPTRPKELPRWMVRSFAERQEDLRKGLVNWLQTYRLQDLRAIAARRGWTVRGSSKEAVARQIATEMNAPGAGLKAARQLDPEHRRVLAALIVAGPEVADESESYAEQLAKSWGGLSAHKQFVTYTRHLCELGLAVAGEAITSYPSVRDFVPDALARTLLPIVHEVLGGRVTSSLAPGADLVLADPYALPFQATEILDRLQQSPVPLRPPRPRLRLEKEQQGLQGWDYDPAEVQRAWEQRKLRPYADLVLTVLPAQPWLPEDLVARLAPLAGGEARLDFLFSLLMATGLCLLGSPVTVWPEVRTHFLRLDAPAQRAALARGYLTNMLWSEIWPVLGAQKPRLELKRQFREIDYRPEHLRADLATLRIRVLRVLACLPEGQWIDLEALYPVLRVLWPRFSWNMPGTYRYYFNPEPPWFLAEAGHDEPLDTRHPRQWDRAQGAFIREIIGGPLHWLGFADLRLERGMLRAVRLHGLADLFFDRSEVPALPQHGAARRPAGTGPEASVEGHCITVRPSAIGAEAHGLLESIARLQTATTGRFVYQLDAQTVQRSFEKGVTLSQILDDWQRLLPMPMPDTLRAQLEAWWQAYGRVHIYRNLTVIEFADDYALAEMKAVTSLGRHMVAEVSPRLVIVPEAAAAELVAELEKAGYTPKRIEGV